MTKYPMIGPHAEHKYRVEDTTANDAQAAQNSLQNQNTRLVPLIFHNVDENSHKLLILNKEITNIFR